MARNLGHSQPPPPFVTFLHLDECQPPCWISIQPGKTAARKAVQQLETRFDKLRGGVSSQTIAESVSGEFAVSILVPANTLNGPFNLPLGISIRAFQGTVTMIRFLISMLPATTRELTVNVLTLGDAVTQFGTPSCVMINGRIWKLFYMRDDGMVEIQVLNDTLDLMVPVRLLAFYAPDLVPNTCTSRWRGFTNQARYLTP
jgi:hypothetical protein